MGKQINKDGEPGGLEKSRRMLLQLAGYIEKIKVAGSRDVFLCAMPADMAHELVRAIRDLDAMANMYSVPPAPAEVVGKMNGEEEGDGGESED